MRSLGCCVVLMLLLVGGLRAGHGADRTVLVVNEASPVSLRVAHHYQQLRGIPDSHMVYLTLEAGYQYGGQATLTLGEAIQQILLPILTVIDQRDLVHDVDAIVYSTGFPYVIDIQEFAREQGLLNSTASLTGVTYFAQFLMREDAGWLSPTANAYFRGGAVIGGQDLVEMDEKEREVALEAYQEYKDKRYRQSADLYRKLLETYRGSPEHWYNLACCQALLGVQSQALDSLEQAVARGWSDHYWTRTDKDLALLRANRRFTELLDVMRSREIVSFPSRGYRTAALWDRRDDPEVVPVWDAIDSRDGGYYLSTMLGYTGQYGNTADEVLTCLDRGAASDASTPEGTMYMVRGRDKRLRARMSQHDDVVEELSSLGQAATILVEGEQEEGPVLQQANAVLGAMLGSDERSFDPGTTRFLPGAVIDNLTPWGAAFWSGKEVKLTEMIRHGAVASSGPVTESDITIAKYPVSRLLTHLRAGCSVAESYYQSVSAPYQLLIVGDALARPYGQPVAFTIASPPDPARSLTGPVTLQLQSPQAGEIARWELSVDGRQVATARPGESLVLDPAGLGAGVHRARVIAVRGGGLEERSIQSFDFLVGDPARRCVVDAVHVTGTSHESLTVSGRAVGAATVELHQGNRILAQAPVDDEGRFALPVAAHRLGVGSCQAYVLATGDSGASRSEFVTLEVRLEEPRAANADAERGLSGLQGAAIAGARRQDFVVTGLDPLCTWPLYEAVQDVQGEPGTQLELRGEVHVPDDGLHEFHFYSTLSGQVNVAGATLELPASPLGSRCLELRLEAGWYPFAADLQSPEGAYLFQCFASGASPGEFLGADRLRFTEPRSSLLKVAPAIVMAGAHARAVLQDGDRTGPGQALASGTCLLEWKRSQRNVSAVVLYPVTPEDGETPCPSDWVVERKKGRDFVKVANVKTRLAWDGSRGSREGTSPAWIELSFSPFSVRELRIRPATEVATVRLSEVEVWVRR